MQKRLKEEELKILRGENDGDIGGDHHNMPINISGKGKGVGGEVRDAGHHAMVSSGHS